MKRELLLEKIEEYKSLMPWFVLEYYQSKLSVPYSFTTLYEYLKEYKRFFDWLIDSGISDADDIASIDIKTLENLTKKDMESFVLYLRERPSLNTYSKKQGVSQTTINRTLSALSSLYKYLTEEVEGPDGEPYFYRNVMKKVSTKKKKETLAARAENIKQKLFLGDETMEFLDYLENEYEFKLSNRAKSSFYKNKERDLAIIALLLASGVRLSEAVNLDLKDINLKKVIDGIGIILFLAQLTIIGVALKPTANINMINSIALSCMIIIIALITRNNKINRYIALELLEL